MDEKTTVLSSEVRKRMRERLDAARVGMVWAPKVGEHIIGRLTAKDMVEVAPGKRVQSWRINDGVLEVRLPSNLVLMRRLTELRVKVGTVVGIKYVGEGGKGRRRYKNYAVVAN